MKIARIPLWAAAFLSALLATACKPAPAISTGKLPQRGYLWQRNWTPAVAAAFSTARKHLQGVVLLGAEIEWAEGRPRIVRANVPWDEVKRAGPCAIALRIAPFTGPRRPDDPALRTIAEVAHSLLETARAHGVEVQEFQVDYDCAQKNLGAYRGWLLRLRAVVQPTRFVITALPSWLEEPEFAKLIGEVDGYVLQVHSVPAASGARASLCDPASARRWVKRAAQFHRPFSVALPTYRCTAGYDRAGKLLGVAMDGVQPSWPPGTRTLEFAAEAAALARLVQEWEKARPAELRELLWYRIPVATDTRNWRWPTLDAVRAGRVPALRFEVVPMGENPVDLALRNTGESDDGVPGAIAVNFRKGALLAADALTGWEVETREASARFIAFPGQRLPPGVERKIGWLRFTAPVRLEISLPDESDLPR